MLEQIQAVLFDLDGTLADSMWMWEVIDIEFLTRKGVPLPQDMKAFQAELEGMGFTETACFFKERFQLSESVEEIKKTWILMTQDKYCREVPLKTGVPELLEELKRRGISMGICSSNSRDLILAVLKAHGIQDYFSCITTCCEVPFGKPSPDVYLAAAKKLGTAAENCLVFEDVPMGILAGKRAGMAVCAVEDAFSRSQEKEKREMADWYIRDYFEIPEMKYCRKEREKKESV